LCAEFGSFLFTPLNHRIGSPLKPGRVVEIRYIGTRPDERLHEILFAREEPTAPIGIEGWGRASVAGGQDTDLQRCSVGGVLRFGSETASPNQAR
jgi:FlaA1/EpsC-like NDP-sugar epimerase